MRTSILTAALLGMFAAACTGTIDDVGGGGDDTGGGPDCGNGVMDTGETCDDGNTTSGDGCSASCSTEQTANPRVTAAVDKTTVMTELGKTEKITLTLTSVEGFAGDVAVAASLVDGANAPITTLMLTGPTSVALAANGTAPAEYTITVPTDASGTAITGTLKLDVTATGGNSNLTTAVNVAPIYTFSIAAATGTQVPMHPATNKTITIRRGTLLRMVNGDTVQHITHGGGLPHENTTTGGQPGDTYEVNTTAIAPGMGKTFGCHSHGDATYATVNLL